MKIYLKREDGITLVSLTIIIFVTIILAKAGISAIAPNKLLERTENVSKEIVKQDEIEKVYAEFDYKYFNIFGEEITKNKEDAEKIYDLSKELDLPINVFTIYYKVDFDESGNPNVDKGIKDIYYMYDKIVSRKEEDVYWYEFDENLSDEEILEILGPNEKELEIINKLENKGIRKLEGDVNFDGILNIEDIERIQDIANLINCDGYMGGTNVELAVGDLYKDGYIEISDISGLAIAIEKLK